MIVLQVVPHVNSKLPLSKEFRETMNGRDPVYTDSFIAFEGYIIAKILCSALDGIEGKVDRERVTDAVLGLGEFDIGLGVSLHLDGGQHQASHTLWPTVLQDGKVLEFDWQVLAKEGKQ